MTDSRPGIFDSLDREPKRREILEVRKRIIAVLKWPVLTLGLIAAILGALQTYQQGRFFFTVIYLGIYGSVFTVFVLDRRTSFSVRAWVLVAGLYLYSVAVLMRIGLSGIGLEIMILACILSAVFWGVRTGLVVIGISTVVIASVAACMVSGILPIHSEHMLNSLSPLAWATAGIYFTLMTVGLVFIPQMFLNRLNDSLSLLEEKSRNLEESNLILHKEVKAREEAEDAVRQSEEKYRYLVESANSVILRMDANGYITFFNEFAQRFFGFAENEILGRNVVGTIVPETESSGRDLQAMIEGICKDPDRYATNENENMCRDGRRVWIAWTNKPIYDEAGVIREVLCIGNDITARKLAEEAVREAYNIINRSPAVAFLWKNAEGWPVEFVSDNVDNMLGYKAEDFTSGNVTYAGIIHPEDLEKLKNQGITFSRYEG
ncbi:MAG: PAS domain S-box protein, partial [Deltaproteobacteria bacterium]|nr:PAS domain S-box protein [Deltaproteobacteria bacterium]